MSLKPLIPSLKEKKRYLAFEVISKNNIPFNSVKEKIISTYKEYFGIIGYLKANLNVLNEWKDNKGIIKIGNKYTDEAKASLTFINNINDNKVMIRCLGVSGIIKKLKTKYMEV